MYKKNCTINPNECTERKCKAEAKIIQNVLLLAWASNYGVGKGTHSQCVAGSYCWDWEYVFRKSLLNQKFKCFTAEIGQAVAPDVIVENIIFTPQHFFTRLHVGNKTKGCTVVIDDGFFTGELIHDLPFPKPDNEGGYVNENPVKRPPGRKPKGTVVPEL